MGLSDLWKREQIQGAEAPTPLRGAEAAEPPAEALVGKVIGNRYRVQEVLGEGGMGIIYLARHKALDKKFVVKVIRMLPDKEKARIVLHRFKREARAIARVNHPNVVEVVDYDILDESTPYIVMEFIEGEGLDQFMKRYPGGIPLELFFNFMKQICEAVQAIHQADIVHRDLKPSNIMVQKQGDLYHLKILDFGLVSVNQPGLETGNLKLTAQGQMIGTPAYMSPEQCKDQVVTRASDIYALGLIAYEMIAGKPAVQGTSFVTVFHKQIHDEPESILKIRPEIPPELGEAIAVASNKNPLERFASPIAFITALWVALQEMTFPDHLHGSSIWRLTGRVVPPKSFSWKRVGLALLALLGPLIALTAVWVFWP